MKSKFFIISILASFVFLGFSCSINPHVRYVEQNHKNSWIEKEHTYRSIASEKAEEEIKIKK